MMQGSATPLLTPAGQTSGTTMLAMQPQKYYTRRTVVLLRIASGENPDLHIAQP